MRAWQRWPVVPAARSAAARAAPGPRTRVTGGGGGGGSGETNGRGEHASRSPRPSEPMSASARVRSHSPTWHGSSAPSRTAPPSCVHRRPVRSPTARMVQSLTRSETVTRCCADSVGALSAHQTPSSFSSRPRTLPLAASRHVSVRSPSSRRSSAFHTPERASSSSGSRDPSAAVRAT